MSTNKSADSRATQGDDMVSKEKEMRTWKRIEPGFYKSGNLTIQSDLPFQYNGVRLRWYFYQRDKFISAFPTLDAAKNYVTLHEGGAA